MSSKIFYGSLFILSSLIYLIKFKGISKPKIGFIFLYSITIIATIFTTYSITSNYYTDTIQKENSFIEGKIINQKTPLNQVIKDVGPSMISTLGLIVTSTVALSSSSFNSKKQYSDLIINLIKNQKELETSEFIEHIDSLIERIEFSKNKSNVAFERYIKHLEKNITTYIDKSLNKKEIQIPLKNYYCNIMGISTNSISSKKIGALLISEIDKVNSSSFKKRDLEEIMLFGLSQSNNFKKIKYDDISESNKNKTPKNIEDFQYICLSFVISSEVFYNSKVKRAGSPGYSLNLFDDLNYDEVFDICNEAYRHYYNSIGHYFKHLHRIFKIINKHFKYDKVLKSEYQGILRAQLSEKMLLVLYYNCTFTSRGLGLSEQLKGSSFWGSRSDFSNDGDYEISHISKSSFWFSNDLKVIKLIYTQSHLLNIKQKLKLSLAKSYRLKNTLRISFNN